MWRRRGASNVFDAHWRNVADGSPVCDVVEIQGRDGDFDYDLPLRQWRNLQRRTVAERATYPRNGELVSARSVLVGAHSVNKRGAKPPRPADRAERRRRSGEGARRRGRGLARARRSAACGSCVGSSTDGRSAASAASRAIVSRAVAASGLMPSTVQRANCLDRRRRRRRRRCAARHRRGPPKRGPACGQASAAR